MVAACAGDPDSGSFLDPDADEPRLRDLSGPFADADVAELDQGNIGDVIDVSDEPDGSVDVIDEPDALPPGLTCTTDADGDGHYAEACGGDDCDDGEFAAQPDLFEACDFIDNDCDGLVNEGVHCVFYAHTDTDLYEVDPFQGVLQHVATIPELWDIDTHPDGTLYGVSWEALYRFDEAAGQWVVVGALDHSGGEANGMAIDLDGTAYLTAGDFLYTIDLETGRTSLVGPMGGGYVSSGDCVVNKGNSLFMSSKHLESTDTLILINGVTGEGTEVGAIGFTKIFGLTAAWGHLFGLKSSGQLISIDEATGQGTLVHTFEGYRWFGAASTPSR